MHSLINQSASLSCTVNWLSLDSLKFISMCSYVYACSHMFKCMCSYMDVEAWDQRWVLFFRFHPPLVFRQGLSLARILSSRLGWLARELPEPTCLCLLTSIPQGSAFKNRVLLLFEYFIQYSMVVLTSLPCSLRSYWLTKCRVVGPKTLWALRLRKHCGRVDENIIRGRGSGSFLEDCLLLIPEIHPWSLPNMTTQMNKGDTNKYTKLDRQSPKSPYLYIKNYGQL